MDDQTKKLIEGKFLSVCSPEMAYQWLATRVPERSVYRNAPRGDFTGEHDHYEAILMGRNDPLIDYGLARYGWSGEVAEKLYPRLDHASRCAMRRYHLAHGGPVEPFTKMDPSNELTIQEMRAWMYNPYQSDDFYEALFKKSGLFRALSDKNFRQLIWAVGRNERLSTPYESLMMDGYDDYTYHAVFEEAWKLTLRAPTNQAWASTLWDCLANVVRYKASDFDVDAAISRWRIDPEPAQAEKWFDNPSSFFLRAIIADLLDADDALLKSDDLALRMSFYKRFSPWHYKRWPEFAKRDLGVFYQGALENTELWKLPEERERLSRLAWELPDPNSTMDAPNDYRVREAHFREKHPEWFSD